MDIENDDNLMFFLDPENGMSCLELFIEKIPIHSNIVPEMNASDEWGTYVSMLTQDNLGNLPIITQGLASVGIHDFSADPSACARDTSGIWHDDFQNNRYREVDNAPTEDVAPEPFVDNFQEDYSDSGSTRSGSEPNEIDSDASVAYDEATDFGEGTSSQQQAPFNAPMPSTTNEPELYPVIQFFSTTHPEVHCDSRDIPSSRLKFYDESSGKISKNMVFKSKQHVIDAVKVYSIRDAQREYRVLKSTKTMWKVECKAKSDDMPCHWKLLASLQKNLGMFMITKYVGPHTCLINEVSIDHRNLDKNHIACRIMGIIKCDPHIEINIIQQMIKEEYGFEISYAKAWYSYRRAVENVYGTWESSVQMLPKYMGALQKYNPGTIVEWNHIYRSTPMHFTLKYVFWAFKPCIDGFQHCRKVISVDGTHLYSKYKHKMLIACAIDANEMVLPLAFAVVDEETIDSWKWFLELLSKHIVKGVDGICLLSDRHAGLRDAAGTTRCFRPPHGVHRYCLRHVASNFNSRHKHQLLKDLCYRAGLATSVSKFNAIKEQIHEIEPKAHDYLSKIDPEKWTFSHDGGFRCGSMTTNISESLNGVLKGARRLPITAIVDMSFQRCVKYFYERQENMEKMVRRNQRWPDKPNDKYELWSAHSLMHTVTKYDRRSQTASVLSRGHVGGGNKIYVVDLSKDMCSCGKWSQYGIPCSHAISVCRHFKVTSNTLVKPYHSMEAYWQTYRGTFNPLYGDTDWDVPSFELFHNPTLRARRGAGRDRTTRIRNEMDRPQTRARQQYQRSQQHTSTQGE